MAHCNIKRTILYPYRTFNILITGKGEMINSINLFRLFFLEYKGQTVKKPLNIFFQQLFFDTNLRISFL